MELCTLSFKIEINVDFMHLLKYKSHDQDTNVSPRSPTFPSCQQSFQIQGTLFPVMESTRHVKRRKGFHSLFPYSFSASMAIGPQRFCIIPGDRSGYWWERKPSPQAVLVPRMLHNKCTSRKNNLQNIN